MKSTYTISFLTGVIRLAHTEKSYNTIEEIVNSSLYDKPFKQHTELALKHKFIPPKNKWIHVGNVCEERMKLKPLIVLHDYATIVHNAGVYNWLNLISLGA